MADITHGIVAVELMLGIDEMPSFPAVVVLDDVGRIPRWNGFVAEPLFDRATVQRIMDWCNEDLPEPRMRWAGEVITDQTDDWTDAYAPVTLLGVERWPIGANAWTWYEVSDHG